MIVYLPSGKMIIVLIAYFFQWASSDFTSDEMMWPCTFYQERWWFFWSEVVFSLLLSNVQCEMYFSHFSLSSSVFQIWLTKFLLMVPNFWNVTFCCFPVRIRNANAVRWFEHWLSFMVKVTMTHSDTILDFPVWRKSLSVANFFVGHSWACGLMMYWPR